SRSPEMVDVLRGAVRQLPLLVEQLAGGGELPEAAGWAAARLHALTEGRELAGVELPMALETGAPRPPGAPVIVTPLTLARDADLAAAVPAIAPPVEAEREVEEQGPSLDTEPLPEAAPEMQSDAETAPPSFVDQQLAEIYRAETASHLAAIRSFLRECVGHAPPHRVSEALHRACHTLAGASKMAEVPEGVRLAEPLNLYLRKLHDHGLGLSPDGLVVLTEVADALEQVAATFAEPSARPASHDALLTRLDDLRLLLDLEIAAESLPTPPPEAEAVSSSVPLPEAEPAAESAPEAAPPPPAPAVVTPASAEVDREIAAVFAEEARELLESADAALLAWRANPGSVEAPAALKRALHTLKGGARMAGLLEMGTLGHEAESLLERAEWSGHIAASSTGLPPLLDLLQATLDHLAAQRDGLLAGRRDTANAELLASIRAATLEPQAPLVVSPPTATPEMAPVGVAASTASTSETPPAMAPAPVTAESAPVPVAEPVSAAEPRELARVDAELLDELLNHAGEVSILRARLEQQWNSVEANLAELSRVTTRLKEQLRRLELETEAQILARHETDAHRGAFDPLELDRYSSLHQYSRALAESAADVASLQSLLEQQTRDGQNLLMQQARSVSDLQNGLMRSRMVAFQRHVPRLSRLVRQVAAQTGKRAELVVTGASGELDRQVLERLTGPFEHLLRNAVVHGIENPAVRERAGKSAEGRIEVALHRENAEMVITIADDGAGLDLSAIRERARARGLVPAGAVLTDGQAMQLVLEPGFSTAREVTADAGRGVGMDVVATAVKKLGGSLQMASVAGRGARFTLRLPFTLAISQALVVRTADELYALPLPTVEAVVRLPRQEVMRHLAATTPTYDYGGQSYRVDHLARYLGAPLTQLPEQEASVPVVLVRAGERSAALVIDELLGNREVVVKPVGPQVSAIEGISGATILGDGRVVLLLDLPSLVRIGVPVGESPIAERQDRRAHALVVDDSITVRRVTQRLLERHGMRVSTARDGIDALAVLQDHLPDIVLLDIEMPRMDGYELAAHLRADVRLREVPIVMITSRVGEKHRAKAIELGVDDYLGKPYQESQLLDAIEPLLARHLSGRSH
ncbi:MAG: response regulator, partial [Gammaproteobacteria bacterium]